DQRQKVVADEPLEESNPSPARRTQPVVPTEPACLQSLHAQGELGKALELSLRRRDVQLPAEVDGPTEVAASDSLRGTRQHAADAPGGRPELLQDQGSLRSGRGTQWKHSHADQSRPRLQEHPVPITEGQTDGSYQSPIRWTSTSQEGGVKCGVSRILAQSPFPYSAGHCSLARRAPCAICNRQIG